jgi:hypothetical protein
MSVDDLDSPCGRKFILVLVQVEEMVDERQYLQRAVLAARAAGVRLRVPSVIREKVAPVVDKVALSFVWHGEAWEDRFARGRSDVDTFGQVDGFTLLLKGTTMSILDQLEGGIRASSIRSGGEIS